MNLDRRFSQGVRAERHKLLGDARRLVIVEALEEGPRQIPELARLLGVPAGRGPAKRYRLRQPLLGGDSGVRLLVGSFVSLLGDA